MAPVEVTGYDGQSRRARVLSLKDGRALSAPLIVAADGAMSALRQMAGIGTVGHDYRQAGIVTTIAHELPHEGVAYEHFRPAGPFASLPLTGNSLVAGVDRIAAEAARLKALPRDAAAAEIEAAMGSSLGRVTVEEGLQSFPLRLQIARDFVGAAAGADRGRRACHPSARGAGPQSGAQGRRGAGGDGDRGDAARARSRRARCAGALPGAGGGFDTSLMAAVTDNLNRLFSNDIAPVRALRDLGLGLVDRMPRLKSALITRAAGHRARWSAADAWNADLAEISMPLVRIDMPAGKSAEYKRQISGCHQ